MPYTIEARRFPIPDFPVVGELFGHLYIEVWDDTDNRIAQINGLATAPDGTVLPIGNPSNGDVIKGYIASTLSEFILNPSNNVPFLISGSGINRADNTHDSQVLFTGSLEEIADALAIAFEAINYINTQNLGYEAFTIAGYNSNSLFSGVVEAMQQAISITDQDFQDAKDLGLIANPGADTDIFQGDAWAPNFDGDGNIIGSVVSLTESSSTENLNGASGDDILTGDEDTNSIAGNGGNDSILGSLGNDILDGGSGVDVVDYSGLESLFGYNVLADLCRARRRKPMVGWGNQPLI